MSHIETGRTRITSASVLRAAAEKCGLVVKQTNKYRWYGRTVGDYSPLNGELPGKPGENAEFVLAIPNDSSAYEIGVVPTESGYRLVYDHWGPGRTLHKYVGEPVTADGRIVELAPKLLQSYHECLLAEEAMKNGQYQCHREVLEDGSVVVEYAVC